MASSGSTASRRILSNSFWYGLETGLETIVTLSTSVAVARYLGPEKLGYFSYIAFFVGIVTRTSGSGLAGATNKYMSEYLALDKPGTARAVYEYAFKYQLLGSLLITGLGLAGVALFGEQNYRLMSSILIVSTVPGIMSWVPAQANNAFQDARKNSLSAFAYTLSYVIVILLTLYFRWDLVGIASALLVGRTVEVIMRVLPVRARLRTIPLEPLTPEVSLKIRRFCFEAIAIQLVVAIVFDRSEMVFLRHYSTLKQLAFYSLSFGLVNNLLMLPRIFGVATGITLMVEASRDKQRVDAIVKNASRYLLLVSLPVHLGAAAIAASVMSVVYGPRYFGAAPVFVVAALLGLPRALQQIPEILMRAADRQKQLLAIMIGVGVLNLLIDYLLIPRFNAVGAAWGNGIAQAIDVIAIWQASRLHFPFRLPVKSALRLSLAAAIMGAGAYKIVRLMPGWPGLAVAIPLSALLYVLLVKLLHGLEPSDRLRLAPIGDRLPAQLRGFYAATVEFVTPA